MKIGIIGCGNVSDIYIQNCQRWPVMEIIACSDINNERAKEKAKKYKISTICSAREMFNNPIIDIVLILTPPQSHTELIISALNANKHAYTEKPLATNLDDGKKIRENARNKNLYIGSAPDTFLGGRLQTCRKLIDDGSIGEPIAATAFFACHGHETWHPDPDFFYQEGGGPMFDIGPYYITALVSLLGPAEKVLGSAKKYFTQRTIMSKPRQGDKIIVNTDTHITGVIEFKNNVTATVITSFDVWDPCLPRIEIYGREGTLYIHDDDPYGGPNIFGGKVHIKNGKDSDWLGIPTQIPRKESSTPLDEVPLMFAYLDNSRGLGLADMVYAINNKRKNRANLEMAYHVLEILSSFIESSKKDKSIRLESTCERPSPLKFGNPEFIFDN